VLACGVLIPAPKLLFLIPALIASCVVQESKPSPWSAVFQEQHWESLFIPNGQGDLVEFFVKLAPKNQSARVWSPKSENRIHIDFTAEVPGFQPTQLHEAFEFPQVLYVSGFDSSSGDGMLVQLVPSFDLRGRIACKMVYRGDCFGNARDMLVSADNHQEVLVLDDEGSLQLLQLDSGKYETMFEAKESYLLARCHYLETTALMDREGSMSSAFRATERKPFHGCIPSLPVGASVIFVPDTKSRGFAVFMESDFKTNPLMNFPSPIE